MAAAATRSPLASLASPDSGQSPAVASAATMTSTQRPSSGYFPQTAAYQQQPPQAPPLDETAANTLANAATPVPASQLHLQQNSTGNYAGYPPQPGSASGAGGYQVNGRFTEEWDASQRGSSLVDGPSPNMLQRSNSFVSNAGADDVLPMPPSRSNTLKKKASLRRSGSLKRSSSRRSMKAGSVRSLALQSTSDPDEAHSAFHCPVPTSGNPTEVLANRFQSWRKMLKDLITYFREVQNFYENRAKALLKLSNASNGIQTPPGFLVSGGLDDAMQIIRAYNKTALLEASKAREIEEDVILALTGLRSDLQQKIKEIKNLSGDFKNTVEKEMDATRRAVKALQEVLGQTELDTALTTGKQDPYLLRLAVDRQVEKQLDEENYLHQAYLNLESSGRELESIVVGEMQKAYNAYTGILKREADAAYGAIEELRIGPISMPKDHEWSVFIQRDEQFVDPNIPIREAQHISYPGRDHVAAQEIRAGLLERKSKYLKSYTAGWYVLSPTHLHEFKSADKAQAPIMSLYLPEQKLGSHSLEGGSSNKFILKGRQTGTMHRGHTWVFRAESHDTMMAWYEDIKSLTEKTPQERSDFVRGHSRSISQASHRSASSDGVVDDDDDEPFSVESAVAATTSSAAGSKQDLQRRPQPGGRFPSDIQVNAQRGLQAPLSPSSVSSSFVAGGGDGGGGGGSIGGGHSDHDVLAAAAAMPGSGFGGNQYNRPTQQQQQQHHPFGYGSTVRTPLEDAPSHAAVVTKAAREDGVNPYTDAPMQPRPNSVNYGNATGLSLAAGGLPRSRSTEGGARRPQSFHQDGRTSQTSGQYDELANGYSVQGVEYGRNVPNGDVYASGGRSTGSVSAVAPAVGITAASGRTPTSDQSGRADFSPENGNNYAVAPQQEAQPSVNRDATVPVRSKHGARSQSTTSISNLHVPGEFPQPTPSAQR